MFNKQLVNASFVESFRKLDPRVMIKNPIMFTVEVVTFVMLLLIVWIAVTGNTSQGSLGYNIVIFLVLLATVLFANFAEAIAEARGKAQADSLRKTREETPAKRIEKGRTVAYRQQLGTAQGRRVRMRRRRYHSRRRRDYRRSGVDRRERHHGRIGPGDPRGGRRQEFGHGRYEGSFRPYSGKSDRTAGREFPWTR